MQIWAESQFSARFRAYHPPESKYLFALELKNPRPTLLGNDAPEEKLRLHVHTNSDLSSGSCNPQGWKASWDEKMILLLLFEPL